MCDDFCTKGKLFFYAKIYFMVGWSSVKPYLANLGNNFSSVHTYKLLISLILKF